MKTSKKTLNAKMLNNEVSKRFSRLLTLQIRSIIFIYESPTMQGFFTLSAEPTEDLGLEDADNDGGDDESLLAHVPESQQALSSSSDDEGDHTSDEEMEESGEQTSDSELSEDDEEVDVYLTAKVTQSTISVNAANFNAFAKELRINRFPVR